MKKLLPYLGYYKRFFKLYILVMFFMYVFSIIAMVIASKFFGTDMFLGVGPIESGMSGSILGVSGAYGAVIAYQMFNELMNIRADRKRVIESIIITSIIFTIISTIICYIMIGVYAAVASGLSGGNMMESFIKAVASSSAIDNTKNTLIVIAVAVSLGNFIGSLIYRVGIIRLIIACLLIAAVVASMWAVYSEALLYMFMKVMMFMRVESNVMVVCIIRILVMEVLFILLMRKAPVLQYAKTWTGKVFHR